MSVESFFVVLWFFLLLYLLYEVFVWGLCELWPFVLQCLSSPFCLCGSFFPFWWVLSCGWGRCFWPWGKFIFRSALLWWSRSFWTSRHEFCFPLLRVLSFVWSRCCRPSRQICFCSALLLVKSIFLTSRHKINFAVLFFLVKPVFWASRHELFSSLDVGVLISWSRCL